MAVVLIQDEAINTRYMIKACREGNRLFIVYPPEVELPISAFEFHHEDSAKAALVKLCDK